MSAAGGGEGEAQAEATMHLQGKLCRIMKQYSIIYQNNGFKLKTFSIQLKIVYKIM